MNIQRIEAAGLLQGNPLDEFDQIEAAIVTSARWLATLKARRDALASHLEEITRPDEVPTPLARPGDPAPTPAPARVIVGPGFDYRGQLMRSWSAIDIYVALLRKLWIDFPEQREAMADALASRGTSRRYVARSSAALFRDQPEDFAMRHSRALVDEWVVDTNLNKARIRTLSIVAVQAAALKWNVDVKVYWRATLLTS
jgi:hypothetical protein